MKKLILIAAFTLGTYMVSAQAPEKMSYQAVVRNATGQFDNTNHHYFFVMSGNFLNQYYGISAVRISYAYPVNN